MVLARMFEKLAAHGYVERLFSVRSMGEGTKMRSRRVGLDDRQSLVVGHYGYASVEIADSGGAEACSGLLRAKRLADDWCVFESGPTSETYLQRLPKTIAKGPKLCAQYVESNHGRAQVFAKPGGASMGEYDYDPLGEIVCDGKIRWHHVMTEQGLGWRKQVLEIGEY